MRIFFLEHGADNPRDLQRRFAFAKNHLGKTLAKRPVVIDLGETQVLKGQMLQAIGSFLGRKSPELHQFQNFQQFLLIHIV
jgi:hypothetical protein